MGTDLDEYKAYLVRMLREQAEHWEQYAIGHQYDSAAAAMALGYRGAYCDVANLIEHGEVAW